MMSRHYASAVLIALTAVACKASAPTFTSADEAVVRGEFDSTAAWFPAGKFDQWAGLWTDDAVLQPPHAKAVQGHDALLAWAKTFPPMESAQFSNVKVWGEGNVAYGTSDYALKMKGAPPDTGKQLVVFRRQSDGRWMAVAGAFNSDIPLPATPPKATAR